MKFVVTIRGVADNYPPADIKAYVQNAVESWCKQFDPATDDFHIGDKVRVTMYNSEIRKLKLQVNKLVREIKEERRS